MKMTFRWYGEGRDPISLKKIKQIPGMSGLMGVLDEKAAGEVWTYEECKAYVDHIHEAGLECEVIESVNVHEDIKMGLPTRDQYIANYCETIRNLAKVGVKVIIYNFMPVFDWLRTDLAREIPGAIYCPTLRDVTEQLRQIARPGDLILTVGAGDIYTAGEALLHTEPSNPTDERE